MQSLEIQDLGFALQLKYDLERGLEAERIFPGIRFNVIGSSSLQVHPLLNGRVCSQGKKVAAGISPILEVASVRKRADVETVILDIEVDGAARSVMGAVKIDGREILAWSGARSLRR